MMGPVTTSEDGNSYVMVVCDYFTKYTECYAVPDITAQTVADKLSTEWIPRWGCPTILHSDQGSNFQSSLFKELSKKFGTYIKPELLVTGQIPMV
jgi:transposase InsO family protein